MKTKGIITSIVLGSVLPLNAAITVKVSPTSGQNVYPVLYGYVTDMTKSRMERPAPSEMTGDASSGQFVIPSLPDGFAYYRIPTEGGEYIMVYAMPDDNLTVDIQNASPLLYSVSGSKLMEDISKLDMDASQVVREYQQLLASGEANENTINEFDARINKIYKDFISANPDAAATAYAILNLQGRDFLDAFNAMSDQAKQSPLYVILEPQKKYEEMRLQAEQHKAELSAGNVTAPDFTFDNAEGKPVSLSDFRGKWVVIDFWGTWCPWCIKGFPALKKAYEELQPNLEVIGVACNDKYDAWLNGLKKYELPWVNVYNPIDGGGQVLQDYAVEGFPTKVIVNPEGKIMNITTGENPDFFNILREMVK